MSGRSATINHSQTRLFLVVRFLVKKYYGVACFYFNSSIKMASPFFQGRSRQVRKGVQGTKTGNQDGETHREPRRGTCAGNQDGEPRRGTKTGNKDGEQRHGTKTGNKDGEPRQVRKQSENIPKITKKNLQIHKNKRTNSKK